MIQIKSHTTQNKPTSLKSNTKQTYKLEIKQKTNYHYFTSQYTANPSALKADLKVALFSRAHGTRYPNANNAPKKGLNGAMRERIM
jgi:hypothetical protein